MILTRQCKDRWSSIYVGEFNGDGSEGLSENRSCNPAGTVQGIGNGSASGFGGSYFGLKEQGYFSGDGVVRALAGIEPETDGFPGADGVGYGTPGWEWETGNGYDSCEDIGRWKQ